MPWLLDALYAVALMLLSPWLLWRAWRTGRYRRDLPAKLFGLAAPPGRKGGVWFHGVSLGEVNLLRTVVAAFRRRHPDVPCVVSATTDTGLDAARRHFADLPVIPFPFDFSWAVRRTLRTVAPRLLVLAEGELWPNLLLAARAEGVSVAVVNARLSPRSERRYARLGGLARRLLGCLDLIAAQSQDQADALRRLGADPGRVIVTGSVKFDGVLSGRDNPRTARLRELFDVRADDLVWVAGSTQAPEEEEAVRIFQAARPAQPRLRLFLVPRQPERFDEVAAMLARRGVPFVRRSAPTAPLTDRGAVVLGDTVGELGALWGLADVAFVGGSLDGRRGGQNMIEPAAFGAAVLFGPHVWNFRDIASRLVAAGGAVQVTDAAGLEEALRLLLADAAERSRLGRAARAFVLGQQGATARTVELLSALLIRDERGCQAA
jgi:3-deoxy-D-manno-octulosonic-acid transferase